MTSTDTFKRKDVKLFDKYCKQHKYTPIILPTKKNVFAIGDLHGDYNLTLNILINIAKVIDKNLNWILPDTYVVQVGDQLDNCRPLDEECDKPKDNDSEYNNDAVAEDIKILELMTELDIKAQKFNSRVISLFGNHELMNVEGHMNYVSYNDVIKFADKNKAYDNDKDKYNDAKRNRLEQFRPGNKYANFMACTRVPVAIIGNFIFVHAGIIRPFMDKLGIKNRDDLYKVSYLIRRWLLKSINKDNVIDIISSAPYSMFWDRILGAIPHNAHIDDPICDENLKQVLNMFQVGNMVVGHTPQCFKNEGINSTCSNKLWRIDFGGSFGFNQWAKYEGVGKPLRQPQILYIKYDKNGDKDEKLVKVLK